VSEAVKADALLPEQRAELEEIRAVVMAGHGLGTANSAWLVDLVDRVAALVAAAEERGFDRGVREAGSGPALAAVRAEAEWRGAEKERERIVAELRREAHPWYDAQTRMLELADRWASS
jgi:hypothetical protein